jgi:hypothetical protein
MRPLARRLEFRENLREAGFMRSESRKMRRMTGLGKRALTEGQRPGELHKIFVRC